MKQPNYADNCVALSLCGVSDTDKCLSVAAQAALATFSERQRGVTAEGDSSITAMLRLEADEQQ